MWQLSNTISNSSAKLPALLVMLVLMGVGMFKLTMHLGKPHRFYRGFFNFGMYGKSQVIIRTETEIPPTFDDKFRIRDIFYGS